MNASNPCPLTVTARRSIKGARQRVLAKAEDPTASCSISWYATGVVAVYGRDADGSFCVTLPAEVVERIKRGPPTMTAQVVPPLVTL